MPARTPHVWYMHWEGRKGSRPPCVSGTAAALPRRMACRPVSASKRGPDHASVDQRTHIHDKLYCVLTLLSTFALLRLLPATTSNLINSCSRLWSISCVMMSGPPFALSSFSVSLGVSLSVCVSLCFLHLRCYRTQCTALFLYLSIYLSSSLSLTTSTVTLRTTSSPPPPSLSRRTRRFFSDTSFSMCFYHLLLRLRTRHSLL